MSLKSQKEIEKKWQDKWKENKVFEPKPSADKDKFFATVPYPYANSVLHIGHGRAYTTADVYVRYQRLLGKNVLFPLAFHISGTPVLAVADGIARGDKKQIALTRDAISDYVKDVDKQDELLKTFHDPYAIAEFFSNTIEESLDSVGISIDWSRKFATGDLTYTKFIEWQYQKLNDAGILKQGAYPILYSVEDENAVGEDDIKDGDVDKVTIQDMTYILFKLKDEDIYFAASTLRPDALFGATNMWVKSEDTLVKIKVNNQKWIVNKDVVSKIQYQFDSVEIEEEFKGQEFLNKKVIVPLINREIPIIHAPFVDSTHGTGIVYSSPAGSPHDYMALVDAVSNGYLKELPIIPNTVTTTDKKGNIIEYNGSCPAEDKCSKYNVVSLAEDDKLETAKQELYKEEHYGGKLNDKCGKFSGVLIKHAKQKVFEALEDKGLGGVFYETSRKAVTRSGSKVIVAVLEGQWFLDYRDKSTKSKALSLLDDMEYLPHHLKDTQKGYINWVTMRPCARKRGIGTPLPYDRDWVIEPLSDSTIYPMLYLIHHVISRENIDAKQLIPEVFEYVFFEKGYLKIVSKNSGIAENLLDEMRSEVDYWRGFDLRYTAGAHMSNHLTFLMYHYALLFPKKYWPSNVTVGGMLIKDGEKISKSKGNGIPLQRVGSLYGADLYRLYVALASNYDSELDFRDTDIIQLEKKFDKWKELIELGISGKTNVSLSRLQKWLISKFYSRAEDYFNHFEKLRMREAFVSILYEFLNDVSYFEQRSSKKELEDVMRFILKDYLILMTPTTPHICEEFWSQARFEGFVSNAEFSTDIELNIDKEVEEIENIAQEIFSSILRTKEQKGIASLKSITIVQAPKQRFELFDKLAECLDKKMAPKEIFANLNKEFPSENKVIKSFVPKTFGSGLSAYLSQKDEKEFLEEFSQNLKSTFSCEVKIEQETTGSPSLLPGRPIVKIE